MINLRRCFACQLHCNYIESGLQVHEVLLTEIMFTQHSQFLNFFWSYCQRQVMSGSVSARFYFAKYKIFPVFRNNVNLTNSGAVITFDNAVSLLFQKITGNLFSCSSCVLPFLCQSKLVCTGLSLKERLCIGDSPCSAIASRCCLVGYPL